jgi:integrase
LDEAARLVDPQLHILVKVVRHTGRRVSSCRRLYKAAVDFETSEIDWRAETDKRRKTRRAPLPTALAPELKAYIDERRGDGSPFVFVHPEDPMRPLDKDRADTMLERAYKLAGVKRRKGGLWHPFRRRWAMKRKGLPLTDVAETGGWDDVRTLLTCYQLADPDTMRRVADFAD